MSDPATRFVDGYCVNCHRDLDDVFHNGHADDCNPQDSKAKPRLFWQDAELLECPNCDTLKRQAEADATARAALQEDLTWCRQILAADMTHAPADKALPEPRVSLPADSVASVVYAVIQELRGLRHMQTRLQKVAKALRLEDIARQHPSSELIHDLRSFQLLATERLRAEELEARCADQATQITQLQQALAERKKNDQGS